MTADEIKRQAARLKRAAKTPPLVVSAATGGGVPQLLRALLEVIARARGVTDAPPSARIPAWQP